MAKQLIGVLARRVNRDQSGGPFYRCRLRSNAPCGKLVDLTRAAFIQIVVLKGSPGFTWRFSSGRSMGHFAKVLQRDFEKVFEKNFTKGL